MTRHSDKPVTSAPEYRDRSLSTLDDIKHAASEILETDGGLLVTYRMGGCWFWRSLGGGWFELMEKMEAV